ncbi:MAG TPA: TMEM175 family protein [Gemmatimonadota bacterium]|nr:TMEM175 family protein [Gemmatimonadota bacterium]
MRVLRQSVIDRELGTGDFRLRGGEVSRIEGFSDAVFAFAMTLLVVSLEVPRSYAELLETIQGFPAFGVCFALLLLVWHAHYTFFRRYGLEDLRTIVLNAILLFLVVFYVYPLKFMFSYLIDSLLGFGPGMAEDMTRADARSLLLIYGGGFVAMFLTLTLLYDHAWRRREPLGLDELERFDTLTSRQHYALSATVGVLSISIAAIGGEGSPFWAGMSYFLLGPAAGLHGALRGRKRARIGNPMRPDAEGAAPSG